MEEENIYAAPKFSDGAGNQKPNRSWSKYSFLIITFLPTISIPIVAYLLSLLEYDTNNVGWDMSVIIPFCIAVACGIWTGCKYARERSLPLNSYVGHSLVWEVLHIAMLLTAFAIYNVLSGFWQ